MADFYSAFDKVIKHEGGYVNDPNDKGGETYMGISRRAHPNSYMWVIIDRYKEQYPSLNSTFKAALKKNSTITNYVRIIYKSCYWDRFKLDNIKSQTIAEQIFDDSVNRGVAAACKLCSSLFGLKISSTPTKELLTKLENL